ncbi:HNH endonuclease [Streptomyces anulatus]|uniref:HNH endonuclease signature motif containing protein n=1 Tax=Streptomyces anulatus TaxID=1892 RepID=UPI002254D595|nr:HNH endonuclease signature motif containing protein [Streptomyces anulatus]MCX4484925.1 HNH endonuclease [Streptomyces anulatus]WTD10107.1 HNH endonuclease [Streptomyces anulatus]WTE03412.1 HNH endonuclease [Streptomyces anulatus]
MSSKYPCDLLERSAATSSSLVDVLRHLGAPMGSRSLRYVRDRLAHYGIDTAHFVEESLPARERRQYPRELLAGAAARSHSIREMFTYMGLPPSDSPYGYLRKRLDRLGIDTSHFTSGRRYGTPSAPRTALVEAVAEARSLTGVLRTLGLGDNSTARARVKRDIERYGLSMAHFTGQGHGRGTRSPDRKSATEILRRLDAGASRTKTTQLRRALDDIGVPHVCAKCGTGDIWRGRRLVLEIDHIDGDRLDNRRENLRYLCPSCHSQTQTFSKPHQVAQ